MADPTTRAEWSALVALIDSLLDTPRDERAALIDRLSEGNPGRRAELSTLLAECDEEPPLLRVPATERFAALLDDVAAFPAALLERYRLEKELGRGGMATVYLAHDVKHGRDVAVKVVRPAVALTLGSERFLREIGIVAKLRHPHIVPLYDSGDADGALYYVMPYESGLSLRQRLGGGAPVAPDEVVVILRDVCDALAYAHAQGIVHRDIKPDNVLLSGRHAMVTDFGVATAVETGPSSARESTQLRVGTPAYMAPEQVAGGEDMDHRADIYAVGALGYELLTGRPPFAAESREALLWAQLHETPTSVVRRRPEVPALLSEIIMRCLEKRPADRWQSADELLQQLAPLAAVTAAPPRWSRRRIMQIAGAAGVLLLTATTIVAWRVSRPDVSWRARWSKMRIERFTDFPGSEVDATISEDGQYVAFLADRDSVFDAFVSRVGSGQFLNLTGGRLGQLLNDGVRNIGFSHDGTHLWLRVADITSPASVALVPRMGGALRPFLSTAVMAAWSPDGSRVAYHELTPGDPIFVADSDGRNPRRIYISPPGLHSHYVSWSPDGRYLYFAHGIPPNDMDVWRISVTGGQPERITAHNSQVGYPVLVDDHTLLYIATDDEGTGPWLYMMDLDRRVPVRLSSGVEHFASIAASAELAGHPRRLVATVSNPTVQLWSVPLTDSVATEASATRLVLPTARAAAPRFAADSSLFYLASVSGADAVWRRSARGAAELWRPGAGAVAGAAAISPDGRRTCFAVRRHGRSTLMCGDANGSAIAPLADSLDVLGAPTWSPDGNWLAITARDGVSDRVFKIPARGGPATRLVDSVSTNPVWSPDGKFILYSGTPRGRSVPLKAVRPDGTPFPLAFPALLVDRLDDSYRFLPDGKGLVVKLGGFRRQDFWLIDLRTGARRRLTNFQPGELLRRFDVSPDGKQIVFERVHENSDIALIEVPLR